MKLLALECSAVPASVAIAEKGKLLGEFYSNIGLTHSATLMPMVESALNITKLTIDDIDAFCIAEGPGSFTGVRIGISTLKGLAMPKGKPCVGVSTLEAMAYAHLDFEGVVAAIMDARCSQCYCALFEITNGKPKRLLEDTACALDELAQRLKGIDAKVLLVGDGAELFQKTCGKDLENVKLSSSVNRYQTARGVALLAEEKLLEGNTISAKELQPKYLRLPQAERELKKKQEAEK